MEKIKAFMAKPITWGGYTKLCGWSLLISIIVSAVSMGAINYSYTGDVLGRYRL